MAIYIGTCRPTERFSTHSGSNHFDGNVCRALERRAATQSDDVGTAFSYLCLDFSPLFLGQFGCADDVEQRFSINLGSRSINGHLLAMTTISTAIFDLVGRHVEVFCQFATQTGAIQCGQCSNLRRFQTRIQQGNQTSDVGRVEDNNYMFYVGAICLYVLTEFFGDGGVSFQQVFTSHTSFAGSST